MSGERRKNPGDAESAPKRRRSLAGKAEDEADPEWKRWFQEVDRKRKALTDPKKRGLVFSTIDKEGESATVVRQKSEPVPVKKILSKSAKSVANPLSVDLLLLNAAWKNTVGEDMAKETEVYSFKGGVLTIAVFSSALLQEIRQFHKEAIARDLRDAWPLSIPLLRIAYKTGKR